MSRVAAVAVVLTALAAGCATMGTKRSSQGSAQIQLTNDPSPIDRGGPGSLDTRPDLGQR